MKKLIVIGIACFLLMNLTAFAQTPVSDGAADLTPTNVLPVAQYSEDTEAFDLEFTFDWMVEDLLRDGIQYQRPIILDGGVEPGESGEELPFYQYTIKVLGEVQNLQVELLEPTKIKADLVPSQVPQRIGSGEEVLDPRWTGENLNTEAHWTFRFTSTTTINGQKGNMYSLKIYPIEHDTDGNSIIHSRARIKYDVQPITPKGARVDPGHRPTGEIKYLIITHASLVDALQPLAMWKSQKGLFTHVITTDEIANMYSGGDTALKMRKYVSEMEDTYDLEYLLIVGDWDKVPTRKTMNSFAFGDEAVTFASDLYFACVDNGTTWNKDGDINYGEEPEIDDAIPDLAHGRLAINNATQLAEVIDDLLEREKNLTWDDYCDWAVYMAGDPDPLPGYPTTVMEHYWDTYGKGVFANNVTLYYDGSGNRTFDNDSFKQVIDDRHQTMCYYGHGGADNITGLFHNDNMSYLAENGTDGSMFAMACLTGWFDDPNQGTNMGAVENCFGEILTETPGKGVVGYIGSSRVAVGEIDTAYSADAPGLQEDYTRASKEAHLGNLEPTVGKIWQETVTSFSNSFYPFPTQMLDNPGLRTFLEYNLLGEPDAPLVFRPPEQLNLNFSVAMDKSSVWAQVTNDTGGNVSGVTVTLFNYGQLGRSGVTNATGEVVIAIPQNNGGIINITATKTGDRPINDTFELPDDLPPEPLYTINPSTPDGDNGYYVTRPRITMTGDEPGEVVYKWDGGSLNTNDTEAVVYAPEGNHTLEFRVKDGVGIFSDWVVINILLDMTPPTLDLELDPLLPDGENGWYVTLPTVTLNSSEPLAKTDYWIDDGYPREYTAAVQMEEGEHDIFFKAHDRAGNSNTINTSVKIDLSAPITILNISHKPDGDNDFYVTRPSIEIMCSYDPSVEIEYKWDKGLWTLFTSPISPPEGTHTLYHHGIDEAGIVEEGKNWSFKLDTTPPVLNVSLDPETPNGKNGYYVSHPTVKIQTTEGQIRYALLDHKEPFDHTNKSSVVNNTQAWTGQFIIPNGEWKLYAVALDSAGNLGYSDPVEIKVDTSYPTFTRKLDPKEPDGENKWYTSAPSLSLVSVPDDTTVFWSPYSEENWTEMTEDIELTNGKQRFSFKAVDIAGNTIYEDTNTIKVDLDEPVVTMSLPLEDITYGAMVSVEWAGTDATSGMDHYEIRVDNLSWRKTRNNTQSVLHSLSTGPHQVWIRGYDEAGNEGLDTRSFFVDAVLPTIETRSPTGDNTTIDTTVEVTFSKEMDRESVGISIMGIEGSLSWEGDKAVFTPHGPLRYSTQYNVTVVGYDIYGNLLGTEDWSFRTQAEPPEGVEPSGSTNRTLIIAAVVIIIILVLIILAAVYIVRSRMGGATPEEEPEEEDGQEAKTQPGGEDDWDDEYEEDDQYSDEDYEGFEDDEDADEYEDDEYEEE